MNRITRGIAIASVAGATVLGGVGLSTSLASAQEDTPTTEQQSPDPGVDQSTPMPSDATPDGCEHGRGHHRGANLEVAADAIGIDASDLRAALQGGATIAQVAEDHGVDPQDVIDALVADVQTHLASEVDEGNLTQDQADQRLADATARITDTVQNGRPERPAADGPDGAPAGADTTQS